MALGYGSPVKELMAINPDDIGVMEDKAKHSKLELTGLIRIFIVIAEIGFSLLPGMEGAAVTLFSGLAAAGANTWLSASENSLSAFGITLDFGMALIGSFWAGKAARRFASNIETASGMEAEALIGTYEQGKRGAIRSYNRGQRIAERNMRRGEKASLGLKRQSVEFKNDAKRLTKTAKKLARQIEKGQLPAEFKFMIEYSELKAGRLADQADVFRSQSTFAGVDARKRYLSQLKRLETKYGTTMAKVEAKVSELERAFWEIKKLSAWQRRGVETFSKNLEKIAPEGQLELIKTIYMRNKLNPMTVEKMRVVAKMNSIINSKQLTPRGEKILAALLRRGRHVSFDNYKQLNAFTEGILNYLPGRDLAVIQKVLGEDESLESLLKVFVKFNSKNKWQSAIRRLGSSAWNEKYVQMFQLIDPNDMGRAPIEFIYRGLKKKIDKYFDKRVENEIAKLTKMGLKSSRRISKVGAKFGVFKSRYLKSYKIINDSNPNGMIVLIEFIVRNTKAKNPSSKNFGGKKPVLVTMSRHDLNMLLQNGSSYWWDVGQKKGWFMSRGGARVNDGMISMAASLFLGLFNIGFIKNIGSIISNWVENITDIADPRGYGDKDPKWRKKHKNYFETWLPKLERSLFRSAVNRSGRLISKVLAGGWWRNMATINALRAVDKAVVRAEYLTEQKISTRALKALNAKEARAIDRKVMQAYDNVLRETATKVANKNNWVGRELQRLASATLTTFETTTEGGYFKFTDGATRDRHGKIKTSTWKKLGKKIVFGSMPTSLRGGMTRHATHRGRIGGRSLISARRKLSQVTRIFSAVTPNAYVKQLRSYTKIYTKKRSRR